MRADLILVAESLAEAGDDRALPYIERLAGLQETEAQACLARWHFRQGRTPEASRHLASAFRRYRDDPWPHVPLMARALQLAGEIAKASPADGARLFAELAEPFSVGLLNHRRLMLRTELARGDLERLCVEAYAPFEPLVPWNDGFLRSRLECYVKTRHPLAGTAAIDLLDFVERGEPPLSRGLVREGELPVEIETDDEPAADRSS